MGQDQFLQLLVAQLRNQDPMSPMDGQEMAAQLAQFTSVEQLIAIREGMEIQAALQSAAIQAAAAASAVEITGKVVLAEGNRLVLLEEGAPAPLTVGLGGSGEGVLRILDARGQVVASGTVGFLEQGKNTLDAGPLLEGLPPGTYSYELEVTDGAGSPVEVRTFTRALIEAVRFGPQGPVLLSAGGLEIPLAAVVEVWRADQS